jgi:hypothetical protein
MMNGVFWVVTPCGYCNNPIVTRRNNPEDTILHGHRRENLKSYEPMIFRLVKQSLNQLRYRISSGFEGGQSND